MWIADFGAAFVIGLMILVVSGAVTLVVLALAVVVAWRRRVAKRRRAMPSWRRAC